MKLLSVSLKLEQSNFNRKLLQMNKIKILIPIDSPDYFTQIQNEKNEKKRNYRNRQKWPKM